MKVYLLYSNPHDEGAETYGIFSTEEKAEKAREVFASKSNHELYVSEFEVDALEKHFERALSDERLYIGHLAKFLYRTGEGIVGKWDFNPCGLDSFLEKERRGNSLFDFSHYYSAHIVARSEEEAEDIVKGLMEELKNQPEDERGWRYIQQ